MRHSRPNNAHAVAVATPCIPAPVSAITRCLPIRLVSRACPSTLLILCEPVWLRSSRLRKTRAPSMLGIPEYLGKRARTACVVGEQLLKFRGEPGIRLGPLVLGGDLIHGGDQCLRDELAAERTEIPVRAGELARQRREEESAVHRA